MPGMSSAMAGTPLPAYRAAQPVLSVFRDGWFY